MIKVSVVMPVYNVEEYLEECLNSVIRQSLREIEIICIDDGSTDRSLQILKKFADADSRIIVIPKENTGYGHSVNIGINRARGEYVSIVESDDFVDKEILETLHETALRHDLDVVKADSRAFVSENGKYQYAYRAALPEAQRNLYQRVTNYQEDVRVFDGYVYT